MSNLPRPKFGLTLVILSASTLLVAALLVGIAWQVGGQPEGLRALVAAALVVPGIVLSAWLALWWGSGGTQALALAFVGGSMIRAGVSLLGGVLLYKLVPFFGTGLFLVWVVTLYLVSLLIETVLVARYAKAVGMLETGPRVGRTEGVTPHGCR